MLLPRAKRITGSIIMTADIERHKNELGVSVADTPADSAKLAEHALEPHSCLLLRLERKMG